MVRKADIPREAALFTDLWELYKHLLPVGKRDDETYWERAVETVQEFIRSHETEFARDMALAVLGDMERRCRNEQQA